MSFSVADKLKIAERLDAFGVHYIEGGWPGSNPKGHRVLRRGEAPPLHAREAGRVRLDAAEGRPRRRRRTGAAARRRRDAGHHDLRQDLAAARSRSPPDDARREPRDDRGHGPLPRAAGPRRGLRRGARVRRIQGRSGVRARDVEGRRARRRRHRRAVRHQRRLGAGRDRGNHQGRARARRRPRRHPHARRHRPRRRERAGRDRRRREPRAGHLQRLRRAGRQLQPDHADSDPRVQAAEDVGAAGVAAAFERDVAVPRRGGQRPPESAAARGWAPRRSRTRAARM